MEKKNTKIMGNLGEATAANYLKKKNYSIICLNYEKNLGFLKGEIDIIAKDNTRNELVFVEVKTRDWIKYNSTLPEENITPHKLKKIVRVASIYLRENHLLDTAYRFDAISVWIDLTLKKARVKHIESL